MFPEYLLMLIVRLCAAASRLYNFYGFQFPVLGFSLFVFHIEVQFLFYGAIFFSVRKFDCFLITKNNNNADIGNRKQRINCTLQKAVKNKKNSFRKSLRKN
jgi:hypothetical protein